MLPDPKAAAMAVLLFAVACCVRTEAQQLIEPRGVLVAEDNGYKFAFDHEVNVFGEQLSRDRGYFANRLSGRINLGNDVFRSEFDPTKSRPSHMLHAAETFATAGMSIGRFWQGRLNAEQLTSMTDMVRKNFWNSNSFTAVQGHLFTWESLQSSADSGKSNTLQAAVFFNESSTYVLYNYVAMGFSKVVLGDIMTGFSRYNSFESTSLPFSGANVLQLPTMSGVDNGTLGRLIYRIDTWPPRRGGCLTLDPPALADRVLVTSVTQDSILGGSLAIVSGRCPGSGVRGTCYVTMGGARISETQTLQNCTGCGSVFLACPVPPSFREGRGTLSLSVPASESAYSTDFRFVSPDEPGIGRITLTDGLQSWMTLSPQNLRISYNPASLSGELKLRVIGYSESGLAQINSNDDSTPMKLLLEVAASQEGAMDLSSLTCPADTAACETHHLGYLEIVDSGSPTTSLRSRIIPLGWFVHKYYQAKQQPQWFRGKCSAMSATDEQTQKVRTQLQGLGCPATLHQAQAEAGRLLRLTYCPELPDGCMSATPAQQCFASKPVTNADTQGAPASVCCYDQSNSRLLYQEMLSSNSETWTQRGSRSIRSHPDGMPSSANLLPGQVSFMSHWYWDTLNFLYCCRWSNVGDCPYYFMHERPSPKVSAHVRGRVSTAVGDPHLTSYSGKPFLFNGYGEYWLLRSDDFQVQGRFLRLGGIQNATFLVTLATRIGTEPIFEATVLADGNNPRFRLQRRIADTSASTEVPLTVNNPYFEGGTTILLKNSSNLVIQLTSNTHSIGVDMYAVQGFAFMNAFVALSDTMKGQTRGLLGRWTDDAANEFVHIDNTAVPFNEDPSQFHVDFCVKNQVKNAGESLFNYDGDRTNGHNSINNPDLVDYRALFSASGIAPHGQEQAVCQSDQNCVFDLRVTQNVDIARLTENYGRSFGALQATGNSSVAFCDKPAIRGISLSADTDLSQGASLTIACAAPLRASRADATVECVRQSDGTLMWQPNPSSLGLECQMNTITPDEAAGANVGLIVGIVVPVVILLIVGVVVLVIVLRRRNNASTAGGNNRPPAKQQQQQRQQPGATGGSSSANSRTNLANSGSAGDGFDNMGHGNRRASTDSIQECDVGEDEIDPRMSYQHAQMEPMEPAEYNPNAYAGVQKPPTHVGKSEVV